jgi:hypothetical protein
MASFSFIVCFVRRFHRCLHTISRFETNAGHLTLFRAPAIDQLPFEKMFAADVKG